MIMYKLVLLTVAPFGVPDETWGEEPSAVVFVDDLPRNPMGKRIKKEIREKYGKP
jgi:acyl-CoA synthetase (AMP-forming)/AMP-acid ligase II